MLDAKTRTVSPLAIILVLTVVCSLLFGFPFNISLRSIVGQDRDEETITLVVERTRGGTPVDIHYRKNAEPDQNATLRNNRWFRVLKIKKSDSVTLQAAQYELPPGWGASDRLHCYILNERGLPIDRSDRPDVGAIRCYHNRPLKRA